LSHQESPLTIISRSDLKKHMAENEHAPSEILMENTLSSDSPSQPAPGRKKWRIAKAAKVGAIIGLCLLPLDLMLHGTEELRYDLWLYQHKSGLAVFCSIIGVLLGWVGAPALIAMLICVVRNLFVRERRPTAADYAEAAPVP
jgi:hypothetical protein